MAAIQSAPEKRYPLQAEVISVDATRKLMVVKHGEIPGPTLFDQETVEKAEARKAIDVFGFLNDSHWWAQEVFGGGLFDEGDFFEMAFAVSDDEFAGDSVPGVKRRDVVRIEYGIRWRSHSYRH